MNRELIEKWFPVKEISRDAEIEMAYKSVSAYIKHEISFKRFTMQLREGSYKELKMINLGFWMRIIGIDCNPIPIPGKYRKI